MAPELVTVGSAWQMAAVLTRCTKHSLQLIKVYSKYSAQKSPLFKRYMLTLDAGDDAGADASGDAGADAGDNAGADTSVVDADNAGVEAGDDAGVDAGDDVGADASVDAGDEAGVDAGDDAGDVSLLYFSLNPGRGFHK